MKRVFAIIMVLLLAISVIGCGVSGNNSTNSNGNNTSSGNNNASSEPTNVGSGDSNTSSGNSNASNENNNASSNVTSSAPSVEVQGITDDTIRIGGTCAFSGAIAAAGQYFYGIEALCEKINAEGGIDGRMLEFIYYDDASDQAKMFANIKQLWENDKVFCIFYHGTSLGALDYLEENDILSFVFTGVPSLIDGRRTMFTTYVPHDIEGEVMADYVLKEFGDIKKVGVFAFNNDMGETYVRGMRNVLDAAGVELEVVYIDISDVDFSSYVLVMKTLDVDACMLLGTPRYQAGILTQAEILGLDVPFIGSSGSADLSMIDLAGDLANGMPFVYMFPLLGTDDPKAIAHEAHIANYPKAQPANNYTIKGQAIAELLIEGLKRAGGDYSIDNMVATLEGIQNWDTGLLENASFSPTQHYPGGPSVFMIRLEDGRFVRIP